MWTRKELSEFRRLTTPRRVQDWLDSVPYSIDAFYRCPRRVLRDRRAHCADGALFAAAALRRLGYPPSILWIHAVRDDGHVLALFRKGRLLGAVAKSNYAGLRYREPVYRSVRELVMSYFEDYFNPRGERTMREYSRPLALSRLDRLAWMTTDEGAAAALDDALDRMPMYPLVPGGGRGLTRVDERSRRAGMLGIDPAGVYRAGR